MMLGSAAGPMLGLLLGAGLVLAISPLLWPAGVSAAGARASGFGRVGKQFVVTLGAAGLAQVSPATVAAVSVIVGLVLGFIAFALVPVVALAVAVSCVGVALPSVLISLRARSRRRATRVLWPDVVDQLVSSVRAGHSLPDAIAALAHTGPPVAREPFATFAADYNSTGDFRLCVTELKARLADPAADRILETVRMSRDVGGTELTTVLRNLGSYLRAEGAIRSEIEARQSWVVNAARLGVAAPWVVLLLLATRPEAAHAYNTAAGAVVIVAGLAVSVVAYRIMVAIGHLPEERRWFR